MQERLQGILQAFKLAKENPEQKNLYITKNVVAEVYQHEDNMRTSLACYLHNDRWNSFRGQTDHPAFSCSIKLQRPICAT